jgi:hypothetical protein
MSNDHGVVGERVHFELSSADVTTAAVIVVYDNDGATRAIGTTERLVITDLSVACAAAMTLDVFTGVGAAAAAGERLFTVIATAQDGKQTFDLGVPAYCRRGVTPKVKASAAGQVTVIGTGVVLRV